MRIPASDRPAEDTTKGDSTFIDVGVGATQAIVTWNPRASMEQRLEEALAAGLSAIHGVTGLHADWNHGSLSIWVTVSRLDADAIHGVAKGLQTVWESIGYVNHKLWVVDDPDEVPSGCRNLLESRA